MSITLHIRGLNRTPLGDIVDTLDVIVEVLGVLPHRAALHSVKEHFGRRISRRKGFRQTFTVQVLQTTVMVSGYDFGDYRALEEVLVNRDEVYLIAADTVLYRTNTTDGVDHNFWTGENGILTAGDVAVVCTAGPEPSPDFNTGIDKTTFTLEMVEPNT